jgi:diguanylate cyclase (GGDEF)-like protein
MIENMSERPLKILVIENDARDMQNIRLALDENRRVAFQLECTDMLGSGLQRLADGDIDLMLLDLSLPDSQGIEALLATRAHSPSTPIVILADPDNEHIAMEAVNEGALDYVLKDYIDTNVLGRLLRYGIEHQRVLGELAEARQSERHTAYYDMLTDLPNRHLFYDALQHTLVRAKRHERLASLLLLDLDGFKNVNNTLGHSAGDLLLQTTAERLKACTRKSDVIARLGGDEFAVILSEVRHVDDGARVASKLLAVLSEPFDINSQELFITTSIGISLYPLDGTDLDSIVKSAEIAMYRAKREGKNNYQFYNLSMEASALQRLSLESSLRKAIDQNKLALYYQPQIETATGKIVGVEALLRWFEPESGMISPSMFIPLAEETGLIIPLGEWVLRSACAQNKAWQDAGLPPIRVAVNLSPRQFRDKKLTENIARALDETSLQPDWLGLEITEGSAMQDVDYSIETLQELKDMGVQLAIDDFGTGYSSLGYLKRFPLDKLKIDRSFVQGIPMDRGDAAIVAALVTLSHNLDMKVIAEGVEKSEQLAFLRTLGCNELQGYMFSKPVGAEALAPMLQNGGLMRDFEHAVEISKSDAAAKTVT